MSYFLTTQQFLDYIKDVTRRAGWANLKPGTQYVAVLKSQGLKAGEKITKLDDCICISNTPERLDEIIRRPYRDGNKRSEMEREGFPDKSAEEFVAFFCSHMKTIKPETIIHRIEFKRLTPQKSRQEKLEV
jgi:hypothetical protein